MKTVTLLVALLSLVGTPGLQADPVASRPALPGRMEIRSYPTGVRLIAHGQSACVIICPAEDARWHVLAREVAGGIQRLGAPQVPILLDTQAVPQRLGRLRTDLEDKSLILLGDLNTNRAVFPLYANYDTCCDARYPGGAGFELRTLVRPLGRAVNDLLVGGSTPEGVAVGVGQLLARLGELKPGPHVELPYGLTVQLGPELAEIFDPIIASAAAEPAFQPPEGKGQAGNARQQFMRNAHLYFYTGREMFAQKARDWLLHLVRCEADVPFFPIDDYRMEGLVTAWRRVSTSPVFTPQERQTIDTRMYETAGDQAGKWWRQKNAARGIGMRHHTSGMLGWWTLLRILMERGQPDAPARQQLAQWLSEAEDYLGGMLRHYWDDADDYQSADSIQNTASYALQSGRLAWYESGLARRAVQKLLAITDNLGWYAGIQGYGEALPGWERFTLDGGLLLGSCGFVYQDGGFDWLLQRFPSFERSWGALQPWGLHEYATGKRFPPRKPAWLDGMEVLRFTPYRLHLINTGDFLRTDIMDNYRLTGLSARPVTEEQAFDKLVIRGGTDPAQPYLLLQGSSAITLSTIDMNAIVRYGDQGELWLVHNTARRSLFFKNAVYVSNGTNEQPIPAACELVAQAEVGQAALAASRLPDDRGTTWTRNLIVLRERFTAVLDQVRVNEPGQYVACCTWRTPGFADLSETAERIMCGTGVSPVLHRRDAGATHGKVLRSGLAGSCWESRQDDVTFRLLFPETQGATSDRPPQRDGATRPTVLRQWQSATAKAGDQLTFENMFYTSGPARQANYTIRRVAPGAIIIRQEDAPGPGSLYLAAAGDHGIELDGLTTDAAAMLLASKEAYLAGATRLQLVGESLLPAAGRVTLTAELADRTAAWLARCWASSQPPGTTATKSLSQSPCGTGFQPVGFQGFEMISKPEPAAPARGPALLWEHPGPSTRGGLIDGVRLVRVKNVTGPTTFTTDGVLPVLVAEPRLAPFQDQALEPAAPSGAGRRTTSSAGRSEAVLSPLQGAEFVLELPAQPTIGEIALFGNTHGETGNSLPPATLDLELTFSRDGFRADQRRRTVRSMREATYHNLYKGHSYLFECYRVTGLNDEAAAVRVRVLAGPAGDMMLTDVQVRAAGPPSRQPVQTCVADLDHDGSDELLAWTSEGDFVVLRADGTESWRRHWPQGIVAVDAWDLEDDGKREVFISRTDRYVVVLNADGSPRWEKDYRTMHEETDERYFTDGSMVYGMTAWRPSGAAEKQVLLTSYFFAAIFDVKGNLIECFRRDGHFTQIRSVPPDCTGSGDLVLRSDIPWTGPVPLTWLHASLKEPAATCSVVNGPALFMEVADFIGQHEPQALIATEQGIGLYAPAEPKTRWEHTTDAPPIGVGVIRGQPGESATIVYGRQDGYVFVLNANGSLIHHAALGEPLQCLTALRTLAGEPIVLAGTATSLCCLSLPDLEARWRQPGNYQNLLVGRNSDQQRLLAVTQGGQLRALSPR